MLYFKDSIQYCFGHYYSPGETLTKTLCRKICQYATWTFFIMILVKAQAVSVLISEEHFGNAEILFQVYVDITNL